MIREEVRGAAGAIPVYPAEAVRAADRKALELGIPGMTLMERAGAGAWRVIRRYLGGAPAAAGAASSAAGAASGAASGLPTAPGTAPGTAAGTAPGTSPENAPATARRILVAAGRGNNGGDGLVVARLAHQEGYPVTVILLGHPDRLRGDAAEAWQRARDAGVQVVPLDPDEPGDAVARRLDPHLEAASLVVDALLGTGGRGAPRAAYAGAIEAINRWRARHAEATSSPAVRVVALDLPSGLDPDTGRPPGAAVAADFTVTFGALKTGILMGPALRFTGAVHLVDIGLPAAAFPSPDAFLVTPEQVRADLPPADPDAHKGSRGRVLVVAGSRGMAGAAVLAVLGALRGGAGLVSAATPAGERPLVAAAVPEALTLALPEDDQGRLGPGAAASLQAAAPAPDAVVLGPGLGRSPAVTAAVLELVQQLAVPVVIDADGLNALAGSAGGLELLAASRGPRVLTPHPGEAARLLQTTTGAIQRDRPAAARELARRSGAVVVLKGARSLVAEPSGDLWIIPTGSPALATGGTGDVLAGLIGALLAGGLAPGRAAGAAAFLHGWAGQRLARRFGNHGVLAGDLPAAVARAWNVLVGPGAARRPGPGILGHCGIFFENAGDQGV